MSQGNCVEVMTMASERFSGPISSSSDEEEIIVKRKKKRMKLKSSQSPTKTSDGSESDEEETQEAMTKSPPSGKKKSRRIKMDSSSEEESSQGVDKSRSPLLKPSQDSTKCMKDSDCNINSPSIENSQNLVTGKSSREKSEEGNLDFIKKDSDSEKSDEESSKSDDESSKSDVESSKSDSESENSSDDDAPPLRLFRNKNPTAVNESRKMLTGGNDLYDDERGDDDDEIVRPDPSEIAEPRSPKRKSARRTTMMELQSETQRLVRESSLNLPYHRPQPKKLSEFMKRPTLGKTHSDSDKKKVEDIAAHIDDNLPHIGDGNSDIVKAVSDCPENKDDKNPEKFNSESADIIESEVSNTQNEAPTRPLTRRERLLQQLGSKLPQLKPKTTEKSPGKFIDLAEDEKKQQQSTGVTSLMQRFMKHAKAGRKTPQKKKEVEMNIIRKQERSDGTGVELVADVVRTTVGDDEDDKKTDLSVLKNAQTPGQRLQLLRQQLAEKMKKRREIERKKREELHKLDNEEVDQSDAEDEEEEDCDWSEGDTDDEDEEAESGVEAEQEKPIEKQGNGIIESSDESEDDDENNTEPFEGSKVKSPSLNGDTSLQREGSVLLFEDSTRSSVSTTLNKSGRLTPALDRTCSEDSFYNSMIPLHQPEVSNISNSSHFTKPHAPKGEFDDTCFESDSRSLSQPFRLDFEASQSQFLDADGFIKESSISKPPSKRDSGRPMLPPGAEDDNAMTDCNMSQLLSLCSAPFDTPKSQKKTTVTGLMNHADSGIDSTQDLLGLCTGNFTDSAFQFESKDNLSSTIRNNNDVTSDRHDVIASRTGDGDTQQNSGDLMKTVEDADVSNVDENSGDLFKTADVDESFGFSMLSGNQKRSQQDPIPKPVIQDDSDEDDDEPITIVRTKKFTRERIARDFVENEAELSGSDDGSGDEADDAGPDEYEIEEPIEELPEEEEIARQVNRVHRRQLLEEDQRDIELLQEAFMGGEEIAQRERKFRWKNIDYSMTEDMLKSDDEDSNHGNNPQEGIEDSQWMKERLEREEFLQKNEADGLHSEDSQLLNLGRKVVMSRQNSLATLNENSNQPPARTRNNRLSVDETSSSRDSFKSKGGRGSFLRRSQNVLAKLAGYQELKNINGPKHSDKMLFKTVSPKANKQVKRKQLSDVSNSTTKEPPKKRKKIININEDSNSVFDLM